MLSSEDIKPYVNFIVAGTQKGGTTALDFYLRQHPNICMAREKEVHFFDNEKFFQRNQVDYTQYHSRFESHHAHLLVGEATPIYMYWHDAPRRIWEYNSQMKLIILLRNPIERAFSHWNMERSRNWEHLPFGEAIRQELQRCREALPYQHRVYSYIDRGFYSEQLRRIWRYFPSEQVLIVQSEQLKSNPSIVLHDICDFLQIPHFENIEKKKINSFPYDSIMTKEDKDYLRGIFEYEIRYLERLLGWDCHDWLYS